MNGIRCLSLVGRISKGNETQILKNSCLRLNGNITNSRLYSTSSFSKLLRQIAFQTPKSIIDNKRSLQTFTNSSSSLSFTKAFTCVTIGVNLSWVFFEFQIFENSKKGWTVRNTFICYSCCWSKWRNSKNRKKTEILQHEKKTGRLFEKQ